MFKILRRSFFLLFVLVFPVFYSCGEAEISGKNLDSLKKDFLAGDYSVAENADLQEVERAGKKYSGLPYILYSFMGGKNSQRGEFYLYETMKHGPYPLDAVAYSVLAKKTDSAYFSLALKEAERFKGIKYRDFFPYTNPEYVESLKAYYDIKNGEFKTSDDLLNLDLYDLKGFSGVYQKKDLEFLQPDYYVLRDCVYLISIFERAGLALLNENSSISVLQDKLSNQEFINNLILFFLMYPSNSYWYRQAFDSFSVFYEKACELYPGFFDSKKLMEISLVYQAAGGRLLSGSKAYGMAAKSFKSFIQSLPEDYLKVFFGYYGLASDCGKAFLYGGGEEVFNGTLVELYSVIPDTYTVSFYKGRLYGVMGQYTRSVEYFEKAFMLANSDSQADYALLNLFEMLRKNSPEKLYNYIFKYSGRWHDSAVFVGFWEEYITYLCENRDWNLIYSIYTSFGASLHADTCARLGYLTGKIVSDSLFEDNVFKTSGDRLKFAGACFLEALNKDHNIFYYRMMALKELKRDDFAPETQIDSIIPVTKDCTLDKTAMADLKKTVQILLEWGLSSEAYEILLFYDFLPVDYVESLVDCFYNSGYWEKGLRVASRFMYSPDRKLTKEDYKYLYPLGFENLIEEISREFNLDKNLVYGLVRTESFFNPGINSSAGAVGLTQLMLPTAIDTAKKLKISDLVSDVEDLKNPELNLRLGCSYLSQLISRLDGKKLDALFAYNGGITRVRRWRAGASDLSDELFLEIVPFKETRDYGRKVLSAEYFYEYLYR